MEKCKRSKKGLCPRRKDLTPARGHLSPTRGKKRLISMKKRTKSFNLKYFYHSLIWSMASLQSQKRLLVPIAWN